jgi:uncharacterized protein (DUF952 family)
VRIFHLATLADWEAAQASGRYTTSTYGRTLAEEGYIHASRADQWQGVRDRFYADVDEPLVLLVIDTERLDAPVVEEEPVPGAGETFPHVYGAIAPDAVVQVIPLDQGVPAPATRPGDSFSRLFLGEVMHQAVQASVVLVFFVAATLVGRATGADWGPLLGALVGLVVGGAVAWFLHRRRESRATVRG